MPINIAIIGAGKIARDQHIPAIAASALFTLVATVDTGAGIDDIPNFSDLAALLASDTHVDAVAICTPPQARAAIARQAIAARLHVLLEKPPAATLTELATLTAQAQDAGITLFAAWHSRFAPMVKEARAWLAGRTITGGHIAWRESVRRWHPGQSWLWAPGGWGVFDPGVNAFSILTKIWPEPLSVAAAQLAVPDGAHTPIVANVTLASDSASVTVDFDFREQGGQIWSIAVETACGHRLQLSDGGSALTIDGNAPRAMPRSEYPALYDHFANLISTGAIDADPAPMRLVADALLVAAIERVDAFVE